MADEEGSEAGKEICTFKGKLILRRKRLFGWSEVPKFAYLYKSSLILSDEVPKFDRAPKVIFQELANSGNVLEVAGCSLLGVDSPLGFCVTPTGGKAAYFKVDSEEQQTEWMSALLEAKLIRPTGKSPDATACIIQ